ncbi:hypothetical protein Anapl_11071 [Anas platyrhynchos]|uniref:Uncharacterized protein n=1 Tax=Anas platyrhynchos TaxID=8839 RepID=R0LA05_ANAPL|nr:hypothetical protein Anapl_11071 [Anas platyrhynchos]
MPSQSPVDAGHGMEVPELPPVRFHFTPHEGPVPPLCGCCCCSHTILQEFLQVPAAISTILSIASQGLSPTLSSWKPGPTQRPRTSCSTPGGYCPERCNRQLQCSSSQERESMKQQHHFPRRKGPLSKIKLRHNVLVSHLRFPVPAQAKPAHRFLGVRPHAPCPPPPSGLSSEPRAIGVWIPTGPFGVQQQPQENTAPSAAGWVIASQQRRRELQRFLLHPSGKLSFTCKFSRMTISAGQLVQYQQGTSTLLHRMLQLESTAASPAKTHSRDVPPAQELGTKAASLCTAAGIPHRQHNLLLAMGLSTFPAQPLARAQPHKKGSGFEHRLTDSLPTPTSASAKCAYPSPSTSSLSCKSQKFTARDQTAEDKSKKPFLRKVQPKKLLWAQILSYFLISFYPSSELWRCKQDTLNCLAPSKSKGERLLPTDFPRYRQPPPSLSQFPTAAPGLLQSSHLPLQHCEQGWVKPFEQVLAMYTSVAKEQLLMDIVPISFPAPCLSYSSVGPTG